MSFQFLTKDVGRGLQQCPDPLSFKTRTSLNTLNFTDDSQGFYTPTILTFVLAVKISVRFFSVFYDYFSILLIKLVAWCISAE